MENAHVVLFEDKKECCACGACLAICPKQAIEMKTDEYGFAYPVIDKAKCIGCGACKRVCGYKNPKMSDSPKKVLAAASKQSDIIEKSASGGIFAVIAEQVLDEHGKVYGAALVYDNEKLSAMHIGIDNKADLYKLQGSKYVQSFIGNTYKEVKADLDNGRKVLFSGTPCQVNGLNSFLKKEYDNLLTIDIICHGVPANQWFQEYIKIFENKLKGKIYNYHFRDKKFGQGYHTKIEYKDKSGYDRIYHCDGNLTSYLYYFLRADMNRPNCYSCPFAGKNRVSDITLGDFWGVNKLHSEELENNAMTDDKGISCVLVNTQKGENIIRTVDSKLLSFESEFDNAAKYNGQLVQPAKSSQERQSLMELYRNGGYIQIEKNFRKTKKVYRIYHRIKAFIPKGIRKKIKKAI